MVTLGTIRRQTFRPRPACPPGAVPTPPPRPPLNAGRTALTATASYYQDFTLDQLVIRGQTTHFDWSVWLPDEVPGETNAIRRNTHTGRPCGTTDFIRRVENMLGRPLLPQKPGRKPKDPDKTTRKDGNGKCVVCPSPYFCPYFRISAVPMAAMRNQTRWPEVRPSDQRYQPTLRLCLPDA